MLTRLSLRIRILLFFALLGGGAVAILAGALWMAARRAATPEVSAALLNAGLMAGFGIAGLTALIWLLFDENIAKAVERLAAGLRARTHAQVDADLHGAGKYLGDLAPAAHSLTEQLGSARISAAEEIATRTAALESEKAQLSAILSRIPLAVVVMGPDHTVTLYDGQCKALIGADDPIGLGRSAFDFFDRTVLEQTFTELRAAERPEPRRISLPSADGMRTYEGTMRRLGKGEGYLLALDVEETHFEARPLAFDFALFDRQVSAALSETPLRELTYVVFDTETTGLDPRSDEVVQIGAIRILRGRLVEGETCDLYVNPGRPIPPASTRVHGVSDAMVADAPPMAEAGRRFHRFASGAVLVAHNAPFDMAFFKRAEGAIGAPFDHPVLDTVLLSAAVFGESEVHTLDALCDRLGVVLPDHLRHTALGDAHATAEVLLKLLPILEGRGITTFGDALSAMRKHQRLLPDLNTGA